MREQIPSSVPSTSSVHPNIGYLETMTQARINFQRLPEELRAASCSPPPVRNHRIAMWQEKIEKLKLEASNDPSSIKWGHLSRVLRLRCTSRGYVGAARTVRVGDVRGASAAQLEPLPNMPDTEEEWWNYERQIESRRQGDLVALPQIGNPLSGDAPAQTDEELRQQRRTKVALIREKVVTWQAQVTAQEPSIPFQEGVDDVSPTDKDTGERPSQLEKISSLASRNTNARSDHKSSAHAAMKNRNGKIPASLEHNNALPVVAHAHQDEHPASNPASAAAHSNFKIGDVSEMVSKATLTVLVSRILTVLFP